MKINELMEELQDLFPNDFKNPSTLARWSVRYRETLGEFTGNALKRGFNDCMDLHSKNSAPRPAEILKHCFEHKTTTTFSTGIEHWVEYTDRVAPELVQEWIKDNPKVVTAAMSEGWYYHLERILKNQSRLAAQRQHQIDNGAVMDVIYIDVPREQLVKMRENLKGVSIVPPDISKFRNQQIRDLSLEDRDEFFKIMRESYPQGFSLLEDKICA